MDHQKEDAATFTIIAGRRVPVIGTVGDRVGRIYALPVPERIDRQMAALHRRAQRRA